MAAELVIVGDEAWERSEWEKRQRRAAAERARRQDPAYRARSRAATAAWKAANADRWRAYKAEWARRKRAGLQTSGFTSREAPQLVGSLHSLSCTGPTVATGCVCARRGTRKIRCYSAPR